MWVIFWAALALISGSLTVLAFIPSLGIAAFLTAPLGASLFTAGGMLALGSEPN
jgi:hypothetical protein